MLAKEKNLIKLLLSKQFYQENKSNISDTFFSNIIREIYYTIVKAHNELKYDVLPYEDLYALHKSYNPTLTTARKAEIRDIVEEIKEAKGTEQATGTVVIDNLHREEKLREIGEIASGLIETPDSDIDPLKKLITNFSNKAGEFSEVDELDLNIEKIIEESRNDKLYTFNLNELDMLIRGIGPGNLIIIFARPEAGKTGFYISLCFAPGGFADQGAKILILGNEEPIKYHFFRAISAYTGEEYDDIVNNGAAISKKIQSMLKNLRMASIIDMSITKLDRYVEKVKPDIVIIDQLDKIFIRGEFARKDESLSALYEAARGIAKRNECAVFAITQASVLAEDKSNLAFSMMANSRTGKAAEADVVIGIGTTTANATTRILNISKNKITGKHHAINCKFFPEISRYVN